MTYKEFRETLHWMIIEFKQCKEVQEPYYKDKIISKLKEYPEYISSYEKDTGVITDILKYGWLDWIWRYKRRD